MKNTPNGTPCRYDGEFYVSLLTGNKYSQSVPLDLDDGPEFRFRTRIAGRDLTDTELRQGGTLDEPINDRPFNITATTSVEPMTDAQRARRAADLLREQSEAQKLTPRERTLRQAEAKAADLEAAENAQRERQALLERADVQEAIGKARLLQTRYQFKAGKKQTELDACRECVELAQSAQFEAYTELHDKMHSQLVESLEVDSKVESLMREVAEVSEAKALLGAADD